MNIALIAALVAALVAQGVKPFLHRIHHPTWNMRLAIRSGDMPSAHTALVTALALTTGIRQGLRSASFAITCVIAILYIYDAIGVRRQSGDLAGIVDRISRQSGTREQLSEEDREILDRTRNWRGHTPQEVLGGFFVGIVTALILTRMLGDY